MNTFKIGQMTDSHLYGGIEGWVPEEMTRRDAFYIGCIREVAAHGVDLIIHTGDLVNGDRDRPYHERFKQLLDDLSAELDVPILICRGNHESAPKIGDPVYREIWGPSNWLHEHRGWYFLGIDRYWRSYSHGGAQYTMSPECFAEVDDLLAQVPDGAPLAAMLHDNPIGISDFRHGGELLHRLAAKNMRFLLFGHVQGNWISTCRGIPHYTVVGERQCFDSSPLSYNIITCAADGGHACDFHAYRTNTPRRAAPPAPARSTVKVALGDDWPTFRGPLGTRATTAELPANAPALAWQTRLPGGLSIGAPTLQGGTLYVSTKTAGRFDQCAALALDAATGESRWTAPLDGSGEGGLLLVGDRGYVGTTAGSIFCLDLATGAPRWRWNSGENIPIASPLELDPATGTVHAGANLELYAVDGDAGTTVWRTTTTLHGCGYFTGGHGAPLVAGKRVFHRRPYGAWHPENSFMVSADKDTGLGIQRTDPRYTDQAMMRHASPILHRGHVIAVGHGLWVGDPEGDLAGDPYIWCEHTQGGATPAALDGDILVSYHSEIVLHELTNGGQARWRMPHEPALLHFGGGEGSRFPSNYGQFPTNGTFSAPLIGADKVLVADTAGLCRCCRRSDGTELWHLTFGEPILSAPIVSGNTLFIGDLAGNLYAFTW